MRTCLVCGRILTPKRGRPGDFCSPPSGSSHSDCYRLQSRTLELAALARRISADLQKASEDDTAFSQRLMRLRSFLWGEMNQVTNVGRLRGEPGRKRYGKKRSGWWRLRGCVMPAGMYTLRISCYPESRDAVLAAVLPFVSGASSAEENGFLLVSGEIADTESAESAARDAGAHSVKFLEDAVTSDVAESAPVTEEGAPEMEVHNPPSPLPEPAPFVARFPSVHAGQNFARAAAGVVHFAEPPTGWEDGVWCVRGSTDKALEIVELAEAHGGRV